MLIIYALILCGFIFSRGFYTFPGIIILLIAFAALGLKIFTKKTEKIELLSPKILLFFLTVMSLVLYGGLYQQSINIVQHSQILLGLSIILTLFLLNTEKEREVKLIYWCMVLLALSLRILMVISSPNPLIDVFDILKYAPLNLLSGINPYSNVYHTIYPNVISDTFAYLPGMIFSVMPFVLIFGDPRYTFITCEILVILMVLIILSGHKEKYIFSLLFLFNPISLFLTEQSYSDSLLLLFVILAVWLNVSKKNLVAAILFGFVISTKQYMVFLIPVFISLFRGLKEKLRAVMLIFFTVLIVVGPFFIWNRIDFLHDIFLEGLSSFRPNGLTVSSLLVRLGIPLNSLLNTLFISCFLIISYLSLNKKTTPSKFFILASFIYFAFFLFNSYAYANYYYLIGQFLLMGEVFKQKEIPKK